MSTFFERNYNTNYDLDRPVDFEACAATVQNIVLVGNCKLRMAPDAWLVAARAYAPQLRARYEPELQGVVIRRDKHSLVAFPSGKYILTGFNTDENACAFLLDVLRLCGFPIGPATLNDTKIMNMVVTMRLPFQVCLQTLRTDADPLSAATRDSTRRWLTRAGCHRILVAVGRRLVQRGSREVEKDRMLSALVFASGSCILLGTTSTTERERFQRRVFNYLTIFSTGEAASTTPIDDVDEIGERLRELNIADADVDEMSAKLHKLTLQQKRDDDDDRMPDDDDDEEVGEPEINYLGSDDERDVPWGRGDQFDH